jgi:hypothetical protein
MSKETIEDLYHHRAMLYITLCRKIKDVGGDVWLSIRRSDGRHILSHFILGISKEPGYQITYLIPNEYLSKCEFAELLPQAPDFDGHTSNDVYKRLVNL